MCEKACVQAAVCAANDPTLYGGDMRFTGSRAGPAYGIVEASNSPGSAVRTGFELVSRGPNLENPPSLPGCEYSG